jgi:trehalose 6-phosphate phosphatase
VSQPAAVDRIGTALREQPSDCLVALDVDGTLAPIVARPEDARALPAAAEAIRRLGRLGARVALVTGRPALQAVDLVGLSDGDPVTVMGHYGLQRWRAGRLDSPPVDPGVERARAALPDLLAAAPDGVHVEDKEHALVVHTRPAADPAAALVALRDPLTRLAAETGLELVPGRAVLELRPAGSDKGGAVRELAADATAVVYVGDDVADLAAYSVLRELAAHGVATLAVASVAPDLPDHDERVARAADLVLPGPSAVVAWLAELVANAASDEIT